MSGEQGPSLLSRARPWGAAADAPLLWGSGASWWRCSLNANPSVAAQQQGECPPQHCCPLVSHRDWLRPSGSGLRQHYRRPGFVLSQGAVYVYFGSREGRLSPSPNVTISCQVCGPPPRQVQRPSCSRWEHEVSVSPKDTHCNLGWTLLAADVSGDGEPDLVAGSPFAPGGGKQRGMVAAFHSGPSRSNGGSGLVPGNSASTLSPFLLVSLHPDFLAVPQPRAGVLSSDSVRVCTQAATWGSRPVFINPYRAGTPGTRASRQRPSRHGIEL